MILRMGASVPIFYCVSLSQCYRCLKMDDVCLIIPTFNRAAYLPRAIESALKQTRQASEIVVVDDGSTDETRKLIAEQYPAVRYLYQSNSGVSAARNAGVNIASSRWIAFLDSDDEWLPHKLERQYQSWLKEPEHKIIHSDEIWIRKGVRVNKPEKYRSMGGDIFDQCLSHCAISPSSVVLEKSLFLGSGGFDERLPVCEDYDLWLKISAQYNVLLCDEPLLQKHAGHRDQLSMGQGAMDRYRVRALHDLLVNEKVNSILDDTQKKKVQSVLKRKCEILKSGAAKRGNAEILQLVNPILNSLVRGLENDAQ